MNSPVKRLFSIRFFVAEKSIYHDWYFSLINCNQHFVRESIILEYNAVFFLLREFILRDRMLPLHGQLFMNCPQISMAKMTTKRNVGYFWNKTFNWLRRSECLENYANGNKSIPLWTFGVFILIIIINVRSFLINLSSENFACDMSETWGYCCKNILLQYLSTNWCYYGTNGFFGQFVEDKWYISIKIIPPLEYSVLSQNFLLLKVSTVDEWRAINSYKITFHFK